MRLLRLHCTSSDLLPENSVNLNNAMGACTFLKAMPLLSLKENRRKMVGVTVDRSLGLVHLRPLWHSRPLQSATRGHRTGPPGSSLPAGTSPHPPSSGSRSSRWHFILCSSLTAAPASQAQPLGSLLGAPRASSRPRAQPPHPILAPSVCSEGRTACQVFIFSSIPVAIKSFLDLLI